MWRISWNVSDTGHHNQWLTSSATPGTPVYEGSLRYKTVEALFDVSAWHVLSWSVLESGDFMWFWGCCIARNSWNMLEYVGICWNSHWTRPGFWMHTSRDFQVEHETWVDRNHGKRKIGRKTCLVQIPSTYPLLPSTKPGVALILKASMVEPHFPRHEIVTVRYLDNCVDDMQETTTAMFGSLMSGQARTDAGNQGFEMAGWDWNLPLKPP